MSEFQRYCINGIIATSVHYAVLAFNMEVIQMEIAGVANFIAAAFGITTSFLGNRFFVFPNTEDKVQRLAAKFLMLYGAIALLHGVILYIWTDIAQLPYSSGFIVATIFQFLASYAGNKLFVFAR